LTDNLSITNNASGTGNIRLYGNIGESGGSRSLSLFNTVAANGGVTLSGANTYSGATIIRAGKLTLSGSINNSTTVSIADGGTFDVSAASFTFHGSGPKQTLAGGSATGVATINAPGRTVTLAYGALLSFPRAARARRAKSAWRAPRLT
jgi:autotransporter-associated beta strand protein